VGEYAFGEFQASFFPILPC